MALIISLLIRYRNIAITNKSCWCPQPGKRDLLFFILVGLSHGRGDSVTMNILKKGNTKSVDFGKQIADRTRIGIFRQTEQLK